MMSSQPEIHTPVSSLTISPSFTQTPLPKHQRMVTSSTTDLKTIHEPLKSGNKTTSLFSEYQFDYGVFETALHPTFWNVIKATPVLLLASIFSGLGGILFGYDTGIINRVQTMPAFLQSMGLDPTITSGNNHQADVLSWITSSLVLAAAVGAIIAGPMSDLIGRRWTISFGTLLVTVGAIVQATSNSVAVIIVGRCIEGVSIGFLSTVVPMYISEITPPSVRGLLGSFFQLSITIGILLAFVVNYIITSNTGQTPGNSPPWRWSLGSQAIFSGTLFLALFLLPESPRWLLNKRKISEAKHVMRRVRVEQTIATKKTGAMMNGGIDTITEHQTRMDTITDDKSRITNVDFELYEMLEEIDTMERLSANLSYASLFIIPSMRLRTSIGFVLQFLQQLTGINAIFYYSSIIFLNVGVDNDLSTTITGVVNVVATLIALMFIEKAGRKSLLIYGAIGMCICHIIVTITFWQTDPSTNHAAGNAIITFICLFIANFAYSWGPICWILPSEIFPIECRSSGMAVATMGNWIANFIIAKYVPIMVEPQNFGSAGTFLFFACFTGLSFFYVTAFVHETSGLTLETVDKIYEISTCAELGAYMKNNIKNFSLRPTGSITRANALALEMSDAKKIDLNKFNAQGTPRPDVVVQSMSTYNDQYGNVQTA